MAYKGRFKPKNPEKYKGDPSNIIYRSSWELKFFRKIDLDETVVWWQSEELFVNYLSPIDGKVHRYFPDVVLKIKTGEDIYETIMIEIKPEKQTVMPNVANKRNTPTGRISRRYLKEAATYAINEAKWISARRYCKERNWKFQIITEKDIF